MRIVKTPFPGLLIIEPSVFSDERGYFFESWQEERYRNSGIDAVFVQDNESQSSGGVVRGLHYQLAPYAQAKLVRVIRGTVYDVVVDLREGSPTFGKWFGFKLDGISKKQLFIPKGFAHGFSVLSETAVFSYKCDNFYRREYERSINPFEPFIGIDWQIDENQVVTSEKDRKAPLFKNAEMNFKFERL
jgi:dTDP-4-dehydrorhamnose 3,5-epimerase